MDNGFHMKAGGPRSPTLSYGEHASLCIVADRCVLNIHITDGAITIHGLTPIVVEPRAANAIIIRGRGNG